MAFSVLHVWPPSSINKGWHRIILDGRANRGKADGEVTAQIAALNTRWDYFLTKRAYPTN